MNSVLSLKIRSTTYCGSTFRTPELLEETRDSPNLCIYDAYRSIYNYCLVFDEFEKFLKEASPGKIWSCSSPSSSDDIIYFNENAHLHRKSKLSARKLNDKRGVVIVTLGEWLQEKMDVMFSHVEQALSSRTGVLARVFGRDKPKKLKE